MADELQQEDTAGAVASYLAPQQAPARAAHASMMVAVDSNPDFEAELRRVSARTGVPIDSARAFPDDVKRQAAVAQHDYADLAARFPATTKFLADPENARLSHDDVQNLSSTESTIGPIMGPRPTTASYITGLAQSFKTGLTQMREGIDMQLSDLLRAAGVPAFTRTQDDSAARRYSLAGLEQDFSTPEFESSTARGVYSGLSSTLQQAPALAASVLTGSTAPLLASAGVQSETVAYGKYRARGATPGQALAGASGEGAVEVATELLPMKYLVQNFGKVGAGHFLTGLLAREVPGEQIATVVQDAIDTAVANPDKTWGQYLSERPDAAYQTLVATITQAGIMEGGNIALQRVQGRSQQAQQAEQMGEALNQFNDLAAASKVRERDAGTAQQFFQTLMQDGRDSVWITPQALAESGLMEQVAQAIPDVAVQLQQSANTGADIRIPIADLMANLAGPELTQSIIPHLSDEPGGFTQTTAAEYLQSGAATELAEEVARQLQVQQQTNAMTESRQRVEAAFTEQLNAVGRFSPQVNQAYSSMLGSFYAAQGARLGITPEEMAQRYPLQLRAEAMPGAKTLDQPSAATVQRGVFSENLPAVSPGFVRLYRAESPTLKFNDVFNVDGLTDFQRPEGWDGQSWTDQMKVARYYKQSYGRDAVIYYADVPEQAANERKLADGEFILDPSKIPLNKLDQSARGSMSVSGDITGTPTIITLLQGADLSTFLHESGHFYLEVMTDMASRPDAPADVTEDMAEVLKWFGVPDLQTWSGFDLEQKRESHEKFARGFEAYLFEGRAPAPELRGLFARFRSWMVNVYRSLTALNVELTPEVRSVFDRMLASADAISQAEREAGFAGMFGTKPDFMTDEEWTAYRSLSIEASEQATHDLETKGLRDMKWLSNAKAGALARIQKEAAEKRKAIRDEVTAEVMAEPVHLARNFFRRGLNPDGTPAEVHKLSIASLTEMYGGEGDKFALLNWEPLGYGQYGALAKEGITPDMAAELFGYESGDAMVRELLTVEPAKDTIKRLTDQRMLEQNGELVDEQSIARAVDEAVYSSAHVRFAATELNALNKAAGQKSVLASAARSYAEQIIARTPVKDLRPAQFTSAAARAGRAADAAFKKGDIQEAAAQKQIQVINAFAAKAALDARTDVQKALDRFRKITTGSNERVSKTRDLDMVMATRAILSEFGIGTRGKAASEYLAAVQAYDPAMAAVLRDRIDSSTENAQPYTDLTVEQLRGLRDEIESLWLMARRSRQMEVDGDLLDRQDVQDQLRARMEEIGIPDVVPGEQSAITPGEVRLSQLQSLRAALRRVESWADAKDGAGTKMGPFRKYVWNTVKDAADAYRADKAVYMRKFRDILTPIAPTLKQVQIAAPELGYTFGKDKGGMGKVELLHAILHTGNNGNKRKLLLGRRWATLDENGALDTARWDSFVNRMIDQGMLTKADFDFAQNVWDLLEEMKPAAQKTHRQAFGMYFDEVTANAFQNKFGDYRGGYVPAMTDSRIVADSKTRALLEEQNESMINALPTTSKGFTKSRVDYNQPLMLDLRTLSQHIDKVLLFTHLEMPVRDVRRILASSTVARPLNRIDPAAYDGLLTPWLKRAALQQVETKVSGSNGLMRFFSVVRARAGMAAMFANVSNTAQQITGFSIAALRVKPKYLASAAADFIRSPRQMADVVAEASPYMANRMHNEVAAMNDVIGDILLNPNVYEKAVAWTQRHTYFMQSAVDNVMGPIIWHGAYNQAMETAPAGMGQAELQLYARRLADSAVRETQGSTLPEDISRIETGNAFVRMFTQFAGYFNMQANILGTEFAKVAQDTGLRKGAGRGFYIMLFGFFIPAWVAQAIALAFRGGPDDEDKDGSYLDDWLAQTFGWGTLRAGTAMVPVVGQTANALANSFNKKPYDDKISTGPAISMIEGSVAGAKAIYDVATGEQLKTKNVRDIATLISMTVGVPASAASKPLVYLNDVQTGKAQPTGPADVARGVITGVSSPQSKNR